MAIYVVVAALAVVVSVPLLWASLAIGRVPGGRISRNLTAGFGSRPAQPELVRMLQELRVGVPRPEALENLLARTDVAELRQFVHAVIQAENYGVPVARVLRSQAAE